MGKKCEICKKTRAHYGSRAEQKVRYCKKCGDLQNLKDLTNLDSKKCPGKDDQGCHRQPTFNFPGKKPLYCQEHIPPKHRDSMINVLNRKCQDPECNGKQNAYYNYEKEKIPKYCMEHKKANMVNVKGNICYDCKKNAGYCSPDKTKWSCAEHVEDGFINPSVKYCPKCEKKTRAGYNFKGETKGAFCATHKDPTMIRVTGSFCQAEECLRAPLFNYPDEKKPIVCGEHKDDFMIDIRHKKCAEPGCRGYPNYNDINEKTPKWCGKHKEGKEGIMINVYKRCQEPGCPISANYNFEGLTKSLYCVKHKKTGMICVAQQPCQFADCPRRPSFNYPNETKALYCSKHIKTGMVNIRQKKCKKPGCDKTPHFNYQGEKTGIFCGRHADENMMDIKNRMCPHPECTGKKHATFNYPDELHGIVCGEHKETGMINVTVRRCEHPDCSKGKTATTALYGYPGHQPQFCTPHKKDGQVFNPRKRCIHPDCQEKKEFAIFGPGFNKGEYCETHAPDDYVCIIQKTCQGCGFIEILDQEGYCATCHPDAIKRFRLAKQKQVVSWLQANGYDDFVSVDQVPMEIQECKEGQKFGYRPDIFYDCGTHFVIIEVDENQHTSDHYQKCDLPRMINIQQALALPTIFIRYNPDPYQMSDKTYYPGEFKRKTVLFNWLRATREEQPIEPLQVIYLFYDNFQESEVDYQPINIMKTAKVLTIT